MVFPDHRFTTLQPPPDALTAIYPFNYCTVIFINQYQSGMHNPFEVCSSISFYFFNYLWKPQIVVSLSSSDTECNHRRQASSSSDNVATIPPFY